MFGEEEEGIQAADNAIVITLIRQCVISVYLTKGLS